MTDRAGATGQSPVAGVDEAGRGPLAGPVVVAAVVLPADHGLNALDDSKKLTEAAREALFDPIRRIAIAWHIETVPVEEIETHNILQATLRGMVRAVRALEPPPAQVLVDGNRTPALQRPCRAIVGGDGLEACISAASILAKVHRDRLMVALEDHYPGYGFARHKGYPTPMHLAQLEKLGPCPEHRRTFAPVRRLL
ncbi:MAG: ribonuclease HII [Xanthomonadales bacterium]|jgi:ribonuclease HII|nr:ribonuclease HII [Xanthomonadales bacterium]